MREKNPRFGYGQQKPKINLANIPKQRKKIGREGECQVNENPK